MKKNNQPACARIRCFSASYKTRGKIYQHLVSPEPQIVICSLCVPLSGQHQEIAVRPSIVDHCLENDPVWVDSIDSVCQAVGSRAACGPKSMKPRFGMLEGQPKI